MQLSLPPLSNTKLQHDCLSQHIVQRKVSQKVDPCEIEIEIKKETKHNDLTRSYILNSSTHL